MIKIASFGCGVDSVAGLLLSKEQGIEYDEIIFADTFDERPETYAYLEYFEKKSGLKITKVKSHLGSIYDWHFRKNSQPAKHNHWCSSKWKIFPIRRYLRKKYGKKERFEMNIFIDYSEFHRMREPDVKYIDNKYPLVEQKLIRESLKKYIISKDYELPIKSGCYFCPFTTKKGWIDLKNKFPHLFNKALEMEKNCKTQSPLINMRGKDSKTLFECACFNG
jgi:hypothetical protein